MKTLIILALAVIATEAAVINDLETFGTIEYHYPNATEIAEFESPASRAAARNNLNVGAIAGMTLFRRTTVRHTGLAGQITTLDVTYSTSANVVITGIQAIQVGASQGASARIVTRLQRTVTVRIQSARGRGFHYTVSFFGR